MEPAQRSMVQRVKQELAQIRKRDVQLETLVNRLDPGFDQSSERVAEAPRSLGVDDDIDVCLPCANITATQTPRQSEAGMPSTRSRRVWWI